ncbi:MAG: NAD(P)H-binding protein [Anaerolineae bacterium]|nr:NAD(P)H-binding protein [Anaerolineae bacterium]MDW8173941.1 NAD(P)H-binding protein [Anaerolineae bacterium]
MAPRILITGGATPLGMNIAAALLDEGAQVSLIVRPGSESRLGALLGQTQLIYADVWDSASLRGRARGHQAIVHTVGSLQADPSQGLSFQRLNAVSARNAAVMCISDGVPHLIFLSAARALWLSPGYVAAKREAEAYLRRAGLPSSIIRAPLLYQRGTPRPLFYRLMSLIGRLPPLAWLGMSHCAPMPLDVLARAIAHIALQPPPKPVRIYYAPQLRRLQRQLAQRSSGPA